VDDFFFKGFRDKSEEILDKICESL